MVTAKQRAWRKKFARMARSGKFRKRKKRSKSRTSTTSRRRTKRRSSRMARRRRSYSRRSGLGINKNTISKFLAGMAVGSIAGAALGDNMLVKGAAGYFLGGLPAIVGAVFGTNLLGGLTGFVGGSTGGDTSGALF